MVFFPDCSYIERMKHHSLTFACALCALLAGTQIGTAFSADNTYLETITNRNLFNLKPPPDPASLVPQVVAPPLPDVKLAGITTLMGTTRAILRVMRPAKPPDPAKEVSLFLTPGGSAEDGIQVLDIDVAHGLVQISNSGTTQTLDITKNAPKAAAAPPAAPTGLPVPPPRPGGLMPAPPAAPAVTSTSRPLRTDSGVIGGGPGQMGNASSAAAEPPPIPSNEQQTWTMALARERDLARAAAGQIRPDDIPPYPPSEITDAADQEAMGNGSGGPQLPH